MGVGGQRHTLAALPPGKTRYPLYRRLGGSQGRAGRVRKISPPQGLDPRIVQPVASRYTDWAIPAHAFVDTVLKRCLRAKIRCRFITFSYNTQPEHRPYKSSLLTLGVKKTHKKSSRKNNESQPGDTHLHRLTSILTSSREPSRRVTRARTSFPLLTGVFFFEGDGELAGPFSTPSGSTAAGILVSSGIVGPYYLRRNTQRSKNRPSTTTSQNHDKQ